jgi:hypothetical protein
LWIGWFGIARRRWRQVAAIATACLIASLTLLPTVLEYRSVHGALGLTRGRTEIMRFSAKPGSFLNPPRMLAFWPPRDVPTVEDFLFPGATMTAVVIGGLGFIAWSRKRAAPHQRSTFLFYVVAAVFMAALTFGPAAPGAGALGWLRPYEWLVHLPGFSGLRVPVRFAMLMALCLAVAGGLALEMILPAPRSRRLLVATAIAVGIGIDGFMKPVGVTAPPGRVDLPDVPAATVLELPPDDTTVTVGAMFRSIAHGRPLINGYSGYIPTHYGILCQSLRRNDPSAVIELARGRTLLIIISERRDRSGYFRRLIESIPGIERGDMSGAGIWYVLRAQPRDRRPQGGTAHTYTYTTLPRSHVVLDFGAPRVVRSLEFALRDRWREFGGRFAIEASNDGSIWQTVWEGRTGGPAIAAALEDQRRVPVQLVLSDITTRYMRLHPVEDWLMDGMVVRGP